MRAVALLVLLGTLAGCSKAVAAGQYVGPSKSDDHDPQYVVTWGDGKEARRASEGADVPNYNLFTGGYDWATWEAEHRLKWLDTQAHRPHEGGPRETPGEPWDATDPHGGHLMDVPRPEQPTGANGPAGPIA